MRKESVLCYNMTTADANNLDGVVPIGRQFDFWGDVETELMILNDGDESLCLGYKDVVFHDNVYIGDQMNFKATLMKVGNTSRTLKIQSFRLATSAKRIGIEGARDGDIYCYDEPQLIGEGTVTMVVKKHLQRGHQPDGLVEEPWIDIENYL